MLDFHIIAGFSDIKREFRTKTRTKKSYDDLDLFFSLAGEVLYTHDNDDHSSCIAVASRLESSLWRVFLQKESYGSQLIKMATAKYPLSELANNLNDLYKSHGFIRFRRL
jgi:hypothetical protein